jgi:hypothetical protein
VPISACWDHEHCLAGAAIAGHAAVGPQRTSSARAILAGGGHDTGGAGSGQDAAHPLAVAGAGRSRPCC